MDLGNRYATDPVFAQCGSFVGATGSAVCNAVGVAKSVVQRLGNVGGAVGAGANDILERLTATSQQGNLHLTLYGEKRLAPPQAIKPATAFTPSP